VISSFLDINRPFIPLDLLLFSLGNVLKENRNGTDSQENSLGLFTIDHLLKNYKENGMHKWLLKRLLTL